MSDTVSTLAAQLVAQVPGLDWNIEGIDRAVELATMLANAGVTDLSQMSVSGSHSTNEGYFTEGGAESGEWVPAGTTGGYRLDFGNGLTLGGLGSATGDPYTTWATEQYEGADGPVTRSFETPYTDTLWTGGKGWDPDNGQYGELAWSPEGHGNVGYKVVEGPDGKPIIVPEWGSSSDADMWRAPLAIMSIPFIGPYALEALGLSAPAAGTGGAIAGGAGAETLLGGTVAAGSTPTSILGSITNSIASGIGSLLPESIATTKFLSTTVPQLLARGVVSGTMSELMGGDFKTGFLTSGLGTLGTGALTALDVPKAIAPYITTAATVAVRGGSIEDFARAAGINYLMATPQQREALNKIFTSTASNITDAVSTFGDASGAGTAVGGTAEDIFGDFEWGDVDPTQDDMYTPDSRSGTLRLEVNGATDPETDFPWGNEDPTQDDMYTPDYRSGPLRLEVNGATEPETDFPWGNEDPTQDDMYVPATDFPWGNEDPTQDDMYTPDYRSGPLRLEVDGATEPEPFQAGDESLWYPPTADPVGDESMWYPPEPETDFPWGDTDPTQDDMYIPDPEGPGSTTGSPTDTSPGGQPNDREDPDWVNTPGTGGTGGTGGGGGSGNTPTPTPENPNWMLGLAALMAASMMQNKSPTTQTKRYQMPTVGAPNLPQSYTVGWQAPDYMRVPNGGYRNN